MNNDHLQPQFASNLAVPMNTWCQQLPANQETTFAATPAFFIAWREDVKRSDWRGVMREMIRFLQQEEQAAEELEEEFDEQ